VWWCRVATRNKITHVFSAQPVLCTFSNFPLLFNITCGVSSGEVLDENKCVLVIYFLRAKVSCIKTLMKELAHMNLNLLIPRLKSTSGKTWGKTW